MKIGSAIHNIAVLAFIYAWCSTWGSVWPLLMLVFIVLPQKVEQMKGEKEEG